MCPVSGQPIRPVGRARLGLNGTPPVAKGILRPLFPAIPLADTAVMLETPVKVVVLALWNFRRREDVLALSREQTDDGYQLVVTECGRPRTFGFRNLERLIQFQYDMEAFLVRTGWRLADFTPDRRGGDDRRDLPREDNDRRRWWTDVVRNRDQRPTAERRRY